MGRHGSTGQAFIRHPHHTGLPVAVVSDELCDTDDHPPHQAGVQSDQEGHLDQPGGRDQG